MKLLLGPHRYSRQVHVVCELNDNVTVWARKQKCLEALSEDYRVWGLMQERVYKTAVHDTADLKQSLIETWLSIPQTVIDEAIDEWGLRLWACVKAKGCQFEHSLFIATQILPKKMAMPSYAKIF